MYTLGIDLHKRTSAWSLVDKDHTEIWSNSALCHPKNIAHILTQMPVPPDDVQVAIEPVAGWRWVTTMLSDVGMDVHIAHPRKTRIIAESTQKTDEHDAYTLARLLASGYFPEARKVSEEIYQLRLLLRERTHIVRMRTSTINRLHGIATTQGLHHIVGNNPRTKRGKEDILKGHNIILKELHTLIDVLTQRIEVFDVMCSKQLKHFPEARLLMTMPSVGIITALTVIAEVADFTQFSSAKRLVSFAGLAPRQRSSGDKVRFGSITHQGSPSLRCALVETAMRIHQRGAPELFAFVERLAPVCGKKKARVALARKMLCCMWSMVTQQKSYDPTKVVAHSGNMNMSNLDTGTGA